VSVSLDVNANHALAERFDAELPEDAASAQAPQSEPASGSGEFFWNPQLAHVINTALAANAPAGPAAGNGAGFDAAVRGTDPKAIDQTLAELGLDRGAVVVSALRREGITGRDPDPSTRLRAGPAAAVTTGASRPWPGAGRWSPRAGRPGGR